MDKSLILKIIFGIIGFVLFWVVIILLICFIVWIWGAIKDVIKRPSKRKVEIIRQKYPLAYYDFIEKNHISSYDASIFELKKIIRSSSNWNETEEWLKEREDTERQFREIKKLYPKGLAKWYRINPSSTKEKVVSNQYKIKDLESAIKKAASYDDWEKDQNDFKNRCLAVAKETMTDFGWYYYDVPFTKLNEDGENVKGNYQVWQFFASSFCLENDLDYTDFEHIKRNTNNLDQFRNRTRYWSISIYESIQHFIEQLCNDYSVSIYLCANNKDWDAKSLNYHYCMREGSPFYDFPDDVEICDPATDALIDEIEIDYDNYPKLKNRHIIIVEMQTDNDHLKMVCKNIIEKNKDNRPLITYISLLKGYEREEMIDLINKEKKKRQEEEELRRKEREAEEIRKAELKRIEEEQEERNRLGALADSKKINSQAYIEVLQQHGIYCLYHFTDESNLESIKEHGGLFSWSYCDEHGITIPMPGGGGLSRMLDKSRGLQDYVRLCFTKNHPMMYVARNEGRIKKPVLLKIDLEVVTIDSTKFSNKNATIKRESVNIGNTLDDLKQIHFDTVKCNTHFDLADDEKSYFQAEVLVKTFVPIKYIKNIDFPLYV